MIFPAIVWIALAIPLLIVLAWLALEFRTPRDTYSIRKVRRYGRGFADLIPYAALVQPDVVLNKDGAFMAAFEFEGEDATILDFGERRRRIAFLNRMFIHRDAGWMFHIDMIRREADPLVAPSFVRSDTERVLEEERRANARGRYVNRYLLAVTYLPPTDVATKGSNLIFEGDAPIHVTYERIVEIFERGLEDIVDQMGSIAKLRRLGERHTVDPFGNTIVQSELLSAIIDVAYATSQPISVPDRAFLLPGLLGAQDLVAGIQPRIGKKRISVLSISGFPPASYPGMLDALQLVQAEFRFSTRVIVEDTQRARKKVDESFRDWAGKRKGLASKAFAHSGGRVNRDADSMADDAESALQALDRGLVKYVFYTAKCVVLSEDDELLANTKRALTKALNDAGFMVRDEDVNAVEGYLGSLWGDGYHDLRKYMLHSLNVGDTLLTTAEWHGREELSCQYCPPGIEPMATVRTRGRADFALDVHYRDIMHTAILGRTGGGKTTLINFLAGNFFRTPTDQFIGLDFNYGMYGTCAFLGGEHIDPLGGSGSIRFGLFTHLDEPGERSWLIETIATIIELSGVAVTPVDRALIEKAIERMEQTRSEFRSLTTFIEKLNDRDGHLRLALHPYTVAGSLNGILDGTGDELRDADFQVIELASIFGGTEKERIAIPVMLLLFRRIERRLRQNRRTLIAIDEAWAYLQSPIVAPKIEEMLRSYRRKHGGVILATQSLDDIVSSPMASTLIGSCATKILLPNPDAESTSFTRFYETLGCGSEEIRAIANAQEKKEYYIKADDGTAMVDLALTKSEIAVYGRASADDIAELKLARERNPDGWREDLLRQRGCPRAADRLQDLRLSGAGIQELRRAGLAIA